MTHRAVDAIDIGTPGDRLLRAFDGIDDGQTVAEFRSQGDTLRFDIPTSLVGKTIQVMPFRNAPTLVVSVSTRIVSSTEVSASNNNVVRFPARMIRQSPQAG